MASSTKHVIIYYLISFSGLILWMCSSTMFTEMAHNPFIWTVTGFMFIFPLFKLAGKNDLEPIPLNKNYAWIVSAVLLMISGGLIYIEMMNVFAENAHLSEGSDVIPSLEVYVRRFLSGEKVYVEIPFDNYEVKPTYFPAMWMPYIIPELFNFDYRLMAVGSFFLLYAGITVYYIKKYPSYLHAVLTAAIPFLFINWYSIHDVSVFVFGTELMPLVFYMFLLLGLTQKNWLMIGLAIGLCTMSRYSYTLFIIPFIVIIWKEWGFINLLKIGVTGTLVILLLYIFPFFLKDPSILTNGLEYYSLTATDQWKTQFWQPEGSIPYHLTNGLSYSYYFFTSVNGDEVAKLNMAKIFNLAFSLGTALLIVFFWFKRKNKSNWNIYLSNGLIIYLIIFYSFLYVPFSYLFMLPLGLGITAFSLNSHRALKI